MDKETVEMLSDFQLSNYIDERCIFCRHEFYSTDDMRDKNITCAGKNVHDEMLFACKECWQHHIKQGDVLVADGEGGQNE